jgi:uncharacterized protein
MKVLAVVDIHGDERYIKRAAKIVKKENPDLIISAGDHTWFGDSEKKLLKALDFGIPVLILPGNHESPEATKRAIKDMKNFIWLHQGAYEQNGVLFVGCGEGGFCCGNNDFEKSKKFLSKELKSHSGKKILVTHEPPFDTKADEVSPGDHVGSKSLRDFIKEHQPNFNICGHIHEAAGEASKLGKTVVVNVGPKGKLITL